MEFTWLESLDRLDSFRANLGNRIFDGKKGIKLDKYDRRFVYHMLCFLSENFDPMWLCEVYHKAANEVD